MVFVGGGMVNVCPLTSLREDYITVGLVGVPMLWQGLIYVVDEDGW